jgi:hypothetical protein
MIDREIYGIDGMINRYDYRQSFLKQYPGKIRKNSVLSCLFH